MQSHGKRHGDASSGGPLVDRNFLIGAIVVMVLHNNVRMVGTVLAALVAAGKGFGGFEICYQGTGVNSCWFGKTEGRSLAHDGFDISLLRILVECLFVLLVIESFVICFALEKVVTEERTDSF